MSYLKFHGVAEGCSRGDERTKLWEDAGVTLLLHWKEVKGNETKEQLIPQKLDVDDLQVKDDDDDVLQALKQAMETEKYGNDRSDKICYLQQAYQKKKK